MKPVLYMRLTPWVLFALSLIYISFPLFAQKNLTSGLIVTPGSDTIVGFISNKNWDKNPAFIQFKQHQEEAFKKLLPTQLKAFQLASGERYESHVVTIDKSATDLTSLKNYPAAQAEIDTVFLTLLVKGKANLYYLKDEQAKVHFFIQQDKATIEELIVQRYLQDSKTGNGGKALAVVNKYKGQLVGYFSDCSEIHRRIQSTKYTPESLQQLFVAYNHCVTGDPIRYAARIEKVTFKVGLLLGGSHTKLHFAGDSHKALLGAPFTPATGYTLGASLDIILPRNHQKWSIYNEFRWRPYQVSAVYQEIKSDQYYSTSKLSFDVSYTHLVSMARYRHSIRKVEPFVNAGIFNALAVKVGNEKTVESRFYTQYRVEQEKAIEHFRKREFGLVCGIGALRKPFSWELRYEVGDGMSSYQNLRSTSKTFNFLLGYSF